MEERYLNEQHTIGIGGVVILFNPAAEVFRNIRTYAGMVERLWIIDNSETGLVDIHSFFKEFKNVQVVQDGRNEGIGKRLNQAIEEATKTGLDWLITMDQDSYFVLQNFDFYIRALKGVDREKVALIGVRYSRLGRPSGENIGFSEAEDFITSGSGINLSAVADIGRLNEELFIDEVDTDLFCRALSEGWKVMICEGVYMVHNLGTEILKRSLIGGRMVSRNIHSPIRLYYITRNYLWVKQQYGARFSVLFKRRRRQIFNTYKNSLVYGSCRVLAFRMILKGYLDFKRGRLGKFNGFKQSR